MDTLLLYDTFLNLHSFQVCLFNAISFVFLRTLSLALDLFSYIGLLVTVPRFGNASSHIGVGTEVNGDAFWVREKPK